MPSASPAMKARVNTSRTDAAQPGVVGAVGEQHGPVDQFRTDGINRPRALRVGQRVAGPAGSAEDLPCGVVAEDEPRACAVSSHTTRRRGGAS